MRIRLPLFPAWLRWGAVIAVGAFIFYVSVITVPPETVIDRRPDLIPLDKWRHFVAYVLFGGSLAYATTDWNLDVRYLALGVIGVTILYGVGIEVAQLFLPRRYFSLGDAYANAIGGLLVILYYRSISYVEFKSTQEWVQVVLGDGLITHD